MSRGDQRDAGRPPEHTGQRRPWKRTPTGEAASEPPQTSMSSVSSVSSMSHAQAPEAVISAAVAPAAGDTPHERVDEDGATDSFQTRLRYLFTTTRQGTGAPWSFNAVARASGGHISVQAVYRLYTKAGVNPSLETIRVLADVFGVDADYFVRPNALRERREQLDQAYAQLEADPTIAFVSRRMGRMSAADRALLVEFVRRLTENPRTPTMQETHDAIEEQHCLEQLDGLTEMRQD